MRKNLLEFVAATALTLAAVVFSFQQLVAPIAASHGSLAEKYYQASRNEEIAFLGLSPRKGPSSKNAVFP